MFMINFSEIVELYHKLKIPTVDSQVETGASLFKEVHLVISAVATGLKYCTKKGVIKVRFGLICHFSK